MSSFVIITSILLTWVSFMGLCMSLLTLNPVGMFWYGIAMIIFGATAKIFLDKG